LENYSANHKSQHLEKITFNLQHEIVYIISTPAVTSTIFNSQETSCFKFLSFIKTDWKTIKMSQVIPYQKVTLISYLYLDLQCYYSERNVFNLSELAPHQHREHQGEKHIFFHPITSHVSLTTP